jgi:hypothetical protein
MGDPPKGNGAPIGNPVLQFVERVPMVKGRCDPKATTATSYAWVVWFPSDVIGETKLEWIAPCRAALERSGDYGEPLGRPLSSRIQTEGAS